MGENSTEKLKFKSLRDSLNKAKSEKTRLDKQLVVIKFVSLDTDVHKKCSSLLTNSPSGRTVYEL